MTQHYQIIRQENQGETLLCPYCGAELQPIDIESYSYCPYCNGKLEQTAELEDFVLDPLVRHWVAHCREHHGVRSGE